MFAAALAGRKFADGWPIYSRWIGWIWPGQAELAIAELAARQAELGTATADEAATSPPQVVARTLPYLQNHQDKMRYDDYRRQGLPITSSHIESLIKEINHRVKGTEKFCTEAGAEAVLQLRADYLSQDQPVKFAGPGGLAGDGCCGRMVLGDGECFSLRVRSNQDRSLNEEFAIGSVRVVGKNLRMGENEPLLD